MRLVFAGTPEFAATCLARLLDRGHHVVSVLTQPDRPAGRGLHAQYSAVKRLALARRLALLQPHTLKDAALQQTLQALAPQAWVVAAYGLILPPAVLGAPALGCLNVHASLLPRWRGAAPIQRAIMAGDRESGVSIMHMDEGLDTGPVYLQEALPIAPDETAGTLHDRLAELGARLMVEVLDRLEHGSIEPLPQASDGVTYAAKLARADTQIDWTWPAERIERLLRALDPAPGAAARLDGQALKIWRGTPLQTGYAAAPGTVLSIDPTGIEVACGSGSLRLLQLQRAGGRRLDAAAFLRGFPIASGARFDA